MVLVMLSGKIAVVGVGGWGKNHVRVFKALEAKGLIEGVIAVDIDEEKLKYISTTFKVETEKSIEGVVKREDVAGVVISTPTPLHYVHAKTCIERGKHVLVEKPITSTLKEALELLELAESNKVLVGVGLLLRHHPAVREVRTKVKSGLLGRVLTIRGKRTSWWPKREMDVGVVRDLAIHDIDLAHYILGSTTTRVYGRVGSLIHDYEDYAVILAEYENESTGCFETNWLTPYKTRVLEITGEKGIAIIDFVRDVLTFQLEDSILSPRLPSEEPLMLQDEEFVKAIAKSGVLKATLKEGIKALTVCEAVLESAKKNVVVNVEMPL